MTTTQQPYPLINPPFVKGMIEIFREWVEIDASASMVRDEGSLFTFNRPTTRDKHEQLTEWITAMEQYDIYVSIVNAGPTRIAVLDACHR